MGQGGVTAGRAQAQGGCTQPAPRLVARLQHSSPPPTLAPNSSLLLVIRNVGELAARAAHLRQQRRC